VPLADDEAERKLRFLPFFEWIRKAKIHLNLRKILRQSSKEKGGLLGKKKKKRKKKKQ
jgi:hypothetical protein